METSHTPVIIYVIVALCDNEYQGIAPVLPHLGNGDDPAKNLYWGAQYGLKTFFTNDPHWQLLHAQKEVSQHIIERCEFVHTDHNAIMIADAFRGRYIKECIVRFFEMIAFDDEDIGSPLLVAYVGHNGLMDFDLPYYPLPDSGVGVKDVMVLACASKHYFNEAIGHYPVFPVVWTTALCAPESYVLESALEAWLDRKDERGICNGAITAYAHYQKCTIAAAKRIFTSGW